MGLSQAALAELARLSVNGISALERGDRRTPQRQTLQLLADALALVGDERAAFVEAAESAAVPRSVDRPATERTARAALTNVPSGLTTFVGRETDMAEICHLLKSHRSVTLTGSGGVGKTRLALETARSLAPTYADGAWLVELATIADAALVTSAIAAVLRLALGDGDGARALAHQLAHQRLLLVFDNCEHVIDEVARVVETLVRSCPGVRVLATSREPLRAEGEQLYRLPSLDVDQSVVLFADRASLADHRFEISPRNREHVERICRRLDGIPLAIELAAARIETMSAAAIAERLDESFDLLSHGRRTALPRHRTVDATIGWSYDLLDERERRFFERLAIFVGGWTAAIATVVCGDGFAAGEPASILQSLVDKSLVTAGGDDERRFEFAEVTRRFAARKLDARGDGDDLARRHARAYLDLADVVEARYGVGLQSSWRPILDAEIENWRVALTWSLEGGRDVELGQRIVGKLGSLWRWATEPEGIRWIPIAFAAIADATPRDVIAALHQARGMLLRHMHHGDPRALESCRHAAASFAELGDERRRVRVAAIAAELLVPNGRWTEAKPLLQEALWTARELGELRTVGYVLTSLGNGYQWEARYDDGRLALREARRAYESLGDTVLPAQMDEFLAFLEAGAGNHEEALRLHLGALPAARARGGMNYMGYLGNLAMFFIRAGRASDARPYAREALDLTRAHPRSVHFAFALMRHASIATCETVRDPHLRRERLEIATRLWGAVERLMAGNDLAWPQLRDEREAVIIAVRGGLRPDDIARLLDEGSAMSDDALYGEALRV